MRLWVLLGLCACAGAPYELTDEAPCPALGSACQAAVGVVPAITEPTVVAPSAAMPDGVVSQVSHNNLDIVWFRGRLFFAFRTAPTHFASRDVVMYIVSTADQQEWVLETKFVMKTDLREPRFLVDGDR